MKTTKQIERAKELINRLQDYIELAKVDKKLKVEAVKENINQIIENIVSITKLNINDL